MIIHPGCPGGSGRGINERSPFLTPDTLCRLEMGGTLFNYRNWYTFYFPLTIASLQR